MGILYEYELSPGFFPAITIIKPKKDTDFFKKYFA